MSTSTIPSVDQLALLHYHRPQQQELLKREIRQLERALRGQSEHDGQPMPDIGDGIEPHTREIVQESLERTQQLHDRHDAEAAPFNGMQKNKLYHKIRDEWEPFIKEGCPTHEMMEEPTSSNVDWWTSWHKAKKRHILAWKNGLKILDPSNDNQNFTNVSRLRTHHLSGADPRKYWAGYEEIAFVEKVEEDIDQITEEQYFEFLHCKALEWSPVTIMRQLGWSKGTYEAAMHRLRDGRDKGPDDGIPPTPAAPHGEASHPGVSPGTGDEPEAEAEAGEPEAEAGPPTRTTLMLHECATIVAEIERRNLNVVKIAMTLGVKSRQSFFSRLHGKLGGLTNHEVVALKHLFARMDEDEEIAEQHRLHTPRRETLRRNSDAT